MSVDETQDKERRKKAGYFLKSSCVGGCIGLLSYTGAFDKLKNYLFPSSKTLFGNIFKNKKAIQKESNFVVTRMIVGASVSAYHYSCLKKINRLSETDISELSEGVINYDL